MLYDNKISIPLKDYLIFPLKSIVTHRTISELHDCKVSKGVGQWQNIEPVILNQRFESSRNCKTAGKRFFILYGNKITIPDKDYLMFPTMSINGCRAISKLHNCKVSKGIGQQQNIELLILSLRVQIQSPLQNSLKQLFDIVRGKISIPLKGYLIFPLKPIITHRTISELHDCKVSKGMGQRQYIENVILSSRV